MPGRGRAPKPASARRNNHAPQLGEWKPTPGVGWQHGPLPEPPDGLVEPSRIAWRTWFAAWFASHWTPADLPGLRLVIAHYDAVQRGQSKANDLTALVRLMDTYGITPAGQQARRWTPVVEDEKPADSRRPAKAPAASPYGHLKVVSS